MKLRPKRLPFLTRAQPLPLRGAIGNAMVRQRSPQAEAVNKKAQEKAGAAATAEAAAAAEAEAAQQEDTGPPPEMVLEVLETDGELLISLSLPTASEVQDLKKRIERDCGVPFLNQQLVLRASELDDRTVLGTLPEPLVIKLARLPFSDSMATLLFSSANTGYVRDTGRALSALADPNFTDDRGRTAMHIAASAGHLGVVQHLVEFGADKHLAAKDLFAPLHAAAHQGHDEVVMFLCLSMANMEQRARDGETPLFLAAQAGNADAVARLCDASADVNHAADDGYSPVHIAATHGHMEVVRILAEQAGAAKEQAAVDGTVPLHIAAERGDSELVKMLCEGSVCVDTARKDGRTALHLASQNGHLEVVLVLCWSGADKDIIDSIGATAVFMAAQNGQLDVVQFLCSAGADKDKAVYPPITPCKERLTPLRAAWQAGHLEVSRYLRTIGAER